MIEKIVNEVTYMCLGALCYIIGSIIGSVINKKSKKPEVKEHWLPLWYGVSKWMKKEVCTEACIYIIKYFPDSHRVELYYQGHDAVEHPYYNSTVMPTFYWAKRAIQFYDKEAIMKYIETEVKKKANSAIVKDIVVDDTDIIEGIKKQIEIKLKEEDYLEVKRLQDKLNKLEQNK